MTTILKGYYLKVTLENRIAKHNGRKVYLSIVEHGNGIPDNALILKINATCAKFSVCLSIRSQCGWKELDQNDSGELTFDLKVEVTGKSQRAPLFPLVFQLCEKNHDQVSLISKSVIPVKAITKIPKKSLRAELVPLGEQPTKPPQTFPASGQDAEPSEIVMEEEMIDEDEVDDIDSSASSDSSSSPRLQSNSNATTSSSAAAMVPSTSSQTSPSSSTSSSPISLMLSPISLSSSTSLPMPVQVPVSNQTSPSTLKKSKTGDVVSSPSHRPLLVSSVPTGIPIHQHQHHQHHHHQQSPNMSKSMSSIEPMTTASSAAPHAHEDSLAFLSALAAMKSTTATSSSTPSSSTSSPSPSPPPTSSSSSLSLSSILCQNDSEVPSITTPAITITTTVQQQSSSLKKEKRRSLSPSSSSSSSITMNKPTSVLRYGSPDTNNPISNISTSINNFYSNHLLHTQSIPSSPSSSPSPSPSCTFNNLIHNFKITTSSSSSPQQPSLTSVQSTLQPSPLILSVPNVSTSTSITATSSSSANTTPKLTPLAPIFTSQLHHLMNPTPVTTTSTSSSCSSEQFNYLNSHHHLHSKLKRKLEEEL